MEKNIKVQLVAAVDSKLAERFKEDVNKWGNIQTRVIEALIRVWLCLPRNVQSLMQENTLTPEETYQIFLRELVDAEVDARMHSPKFAALRKNFLALLKSAEGGEGGKKKS